MLEDFDKTIIKLSKTYHIPPLEADDLAQELRLHLWIKRDKYDPSKASYENWAYITCRNKIRDLAEYYKAKKRDKSRDISLEELQEKGAEF